MLTRANTIAHALYLARKRRRSQSISVTVPNLVGLTQNAARVAVLEAGLTNNVVTGSVDPVASQLPSSGSNVAPHSFVDITMTS